MSSFQDNFEKAVEAAKRPVYKPIVKLIRRHWPPTAPTDKRFAIQIDEFHSDSMIESDAKEALATVKSWLRHVKTLDEIEALRTVENVSDGIYVEYRPRAESAHSFPSEALVESKDRNVRDTAKHKLRDIALRVLQGTKHTRWSHLPRALGGFAE
jgi:hypothetical protein